MNQQEEFIERYRQEKPILKAWGELVKKELLCLCECAENKSYSNIFKVPIDCRIKTEESILAKAFYRNKGYRNPYSDITDKVGIRIVVLLLSDVEMVSELVKSSSAWDYSHDKSIEDERRNKPTTFIYQSEHFIVRNKDEMASGSLVVPRGTPCEIQIRTLLQHAYSELTHDLTYKPSLLATPEVSRLIARSMALIETADDIFMESVKKMEEYEKDYTTLLSTLKCIYKSNIGQCNNDPTINTIFFEAYRDLIIGENRECILDFYNETSNQYIFKKIKEKLRLLFFQQPIVLYIYYLAKENDHAAKINWPITLEYLDLIFSDVGISSDY